MLFQIRYQGIAYLVDPVINMEVSVYYIYRFSSILNHRNQILPVIDDDTIRRKW